MLKPSMQDLMKQVNNRYLLVNLSAQRARDLSAMEEAQELRLEEKAIKVALDEICEDKIEYRPGPKPEPKVDFLAAMTEDTEDDGLIASDEPQETPELPSEE